MRIYFSARDQKGYSDLVQPDGGTVGVFHETGEAGPYERIEYRRIPLGDFTANES